MKFFTWWGGGQATKQSPTGQQTPVLLNSSEVSGVAPTSERALGLSAVWACTRVLVQSGSTLPLGVYDSRDTHMVKVPRTDNLAYVLNKPNSYMTGQQFKAAMWVSRVLWGNAYALITRNKQGRITSLQPIHPEFVLVHRDKGKLLYKVGEKHVYPQEQILHWRGWSPDGTVGLSTLSAMMPTLGVSIASERKASAAFSGTPTGFLKTESMPDDAQREQIMSHYNGVGEDASLWLLPGGMEYQEIGLPPDALQMLETREFQVGEVCRFFGVPSVLVEGGNNSAAWPASYEQQMMSFLNLTLRPYLCEFEDAIDNTLAGNRPNIQVRHDTTEFLRTDSQSRASYYSTMIQAGVMTINEARAKEDLPPVDGGDIPRSQMALGPINETEEQRDADNQIDKQ